VENFLIYLALGIRFRKTDVQNYTQVTCQLFTLSFFKMFNALVRASSSLTSPIVDAVQKDIRMQQAKELDERIFGQYEPSKKGFEIDENDTTPLRLLSLDGGGVRGLSTLLILRELMKELAPEEKDPYRLPKPCDYFDMIAGTSTGGLIAIMLGRLRMGVQDAINCYLKLCKEVFESSAFNQTIHFLPGGLSVFSASKLELILRDIIREKTASPNMLDPLGSEGCKTFVVASELGNRTGPVLLRTYNKGKSDLNPIICNIWEAARATSAAPYFFAPIIIDNKKYIDGGLGFCNPSHVILEEAYKVWGDRQIGCLVSIGTGKPRDREIAPKAPSIIGSLPGASSFVDAMSIIPSVFDMALDCEAIHTSLQLLFERKEKKGTYLRFNVEKGLDKKDVVMHEHEKLHLVENCTHVYLGYVQVKKDIALFKKIFEDRPSGAPPPYEKQ